MLSATPAKETLPRVLGPLQALGMIVGGVIGGSIFLVPAVVASRVPYLGLAVLVWVAGAALSIAGALTIAELAAMLPKAGGGYVYVRAAFGDLAGFLFCWADAILTRAGAAATTSFTVGIYASQIIRVPSGVALPAWQGFLALLVLAGLGTLNVLGTRASADVQVAGMFLKAIALSSALILPLLFWRGPNHFADAPLWPRAVSADTALATLAAIVPVMWTYGGWDQLSHLAEEIKAPGKNLPRVFAFGLLIVAALYVAVVLGIHLVLPYSSVASSDAAGAAMFKELFGDAGLMAISIVLVMSGVIAANGAVMAGPRACYALARDGDAPRWLARIHPRHETPADAIVALTAWSAALIVVGVVFMIVPPPARLPGMVVNAWMQLQRTPLFIVLLTYVMFAYLTSQAFVVVSAFVLRRKHPDWERPFRVPLWPVTPLFALGSILALMISIAYNAPMQAVAGIAIVVVGIPVRLVVRRDRLPQLPVV